MRSSQGGGGSSETGHRIRVVVRLRPTAATKTIHVDQAACTLTIPNSRGEALMSSSAQETRSVVDHTAEGLRFGVDRIYESSATQSDVFEHEAAPLVSGALEGVTGTLLAYGQTGAGKTYTVLGKGGTTSGAAYDDRGLVPRSISRLYELAAKRRRSGSSVEIRWSCIEVYNETLIDLLKPGSREGEGDFVSPFSREALRRSLSRLQGCPHPQETCDSSFWTSDELSSRSRRVDTELL